MVTGLEYYEFLRDFGLDDIKKVDENLRKLNEKEIDHLAASFLEYYNSGFPHILSELRKVEKEFVTYPLHGIRRIKPDFIKQILLYSEKIVIQDPIFNSIFNPSYVIPNYSAIVDGIKYGLESLSNIKSAIESDYVCIVPPLFIKEELQQQYDEAVEKDSADPIFRNCVINNIQHKLYRESNALVFSYGADDYKFFRYGRITGHEPGPDGSLMVKMETPDNLDAAIMSKYKITEEDLQNWFNSELYNEIVRTSRKYNKEILVADTLNSNLITDTKIYKKIIEQKNHNNGFVTFDLLNVRMTILNNVTIDDVIKIRETDDDSFKQFRINMKKYIQEIESDNVEDGGEELTKKASILSEEYIRPEINKIRKELHLMRRKRVLRGFPRMLLAGVSLGISIASGNPWISLISQGVLFERIRELSDEYATHLEEMAELKKNSMYFLWNIGVDGSASDQKANYFPAKFIIDGKESAKKLPGLGIRTYD